MARRARVLARHRQHTILPVAWRMPASADEESTLDLPATLGTSVLLAVRGGLCSELRPIRLLHAEEVTRPIVEEALRAHRATEVWLLPVAPYRWRQLQLPDASGVRSIG